MGEPDLPSGDWSLMTVTNGVGNMALSCSAAGGLVGDGEFRTSGVS